MLLLHLKERIFLLTYLESMVVVLKLWSPFSEWIFLFGEPTFYTYGGRQHPPWFLCSLACVETRPWWSPSSGKKCHVRGDWRVTWRLESHVELRRWIAKMSQVRGPTWMIGSGEETTHATLKNPSTAISLTFLIFGKILQELKGKLTLSMWPLQIHMRPASATSLVIF